jgi:hypothetical protein
MLRVYVQRHFSLKSHYTTEVSSGRFIEADFIALYKAERLIVFVPIQSVQQYSSPDETLFQIIEGKAEHENETIKIKVRGLFPSIPRNAQTRPKKHNQKYGGTTL